MCANEESDKLGIIYMGHHRNLKNVKIIYVKKVVLNGSVLSNKW